MFVCLRFLLIFIESKTNLKNELIKFKIAVHSSSFTQCVVCFVFVIFHGCKPDPSDTFAERG